jgi:hypothetical protein
MQYQLFDELSLTLRMRALEEIDLTRIEEIRALDAALPHFGLRRSIAAGLVALGVRLDESAGERALAATAARIAR